MCDGGAFVVFGCYVLVGIFHPVSWLFGLRTCKCLQRPILRVLARRGASARFRTNYLREMDQAQVLSLLASVVISFHQEGSWRFMRRVLWSTRLLARGISWLS